MVLVLVSVEYNSILKFQVVKSLGEAGQTPVALVEEAWKKKP